MSEILTLEGLFDYQDTDGALLVEIPAGSLVIDAVLNKTTAWDVVGISTIGWTDDHDGLVRSYQMNLITAEVQRISVARYFPTATVIRVYIDQGAAVQGVAELTLTYIPLTAGEAFQIRLYEAEITYQTVTGTTLFTAPAGCICQERLLNRTEAWDVITNLTIGTAADPDQLVKDYQHSAIDPPGVERIQIPYYYAAATPIIITVDHGAATAGAMTALFVCLIPIGDATNDLDSLTARLISDVPSYDSGPTATQYQQCVKDAVTNYSTRVGMIRYHTVEVVEGTAAYDLPSDFFKLLDLAEPFSAGETFVTTGGLVPVSTSFEGYNYEIIGRTLTINPTPEFTTDVEIQYQATHVLNDANSYPYLLETDIEAVMHKAAACALLILANKATQRAWSYKIGDESVDKKNQAKEMREQAKQHLVDYEAAIKSMRGGGTIGTRARYSTTERAGFSELKEL